MADPKRGRGRPRKNPLPSDDDDAAAATAPAPEKRGRGRPRKDAAPVAPKRGPGRPRKTPLAVADDASESDSESAPPAKRGRGRPPKAPLPKPAAKAAPKSKRGRRKAVRTDAVPSGHARYDTLDVFTHKKFQGNALAVVHLPSYDDADGIVDDPEVNQAIAKEFNYSETTFVRPLEDGQWEVDIFTPFEQLPFAGHPIIGTICALAMHERTLESGTLSILAGEVPFTIERNFRFGAMGPPPAPIVAAAQIPHDVHLHSTGLAAQTLADMQPNLAPLLPAGQSSWPMLSITKGMAFVLVKVPSMAALGEVKTTSVDVATKVDLDADFAPSFVCTYFYFVEDVEDDGAKQRIHSRMIERDIGEDPVTGSGACALAAYLALLMFAGSDKREAEFEVTQGEHLGRSGTPTIRVEGDADGVIQTMVLKGQSVPVMSGIVAMNFEHLGLKYFP